MLTLRQRLSIIIVSALVIIAAIVWYLLYGKPKPNTNPNDTPITPTTQTPTSKTNSVTKTTSTTPVAPVVLPAYSEDMYVRQLTKIFVERFASNSNQNDRGNITDVMALATPTMQTWLKTQVVKVDNRDYAGAVTEVLASKVKEKTVTTATVTFEAQQTLESKKYTDIGAAKKEVIQKTGSVKLVKVGSDWKVDGLYWN